MSSSQCNLCNLTKADKTGSHIFSWFLIRDAVNKEGIKQRNNEIVFSISETEFVETYFGRDQSNPIAVERIKGRELTDDEIEHMMKSNPFTKDYILCSKCEERLQVMETAVAEDIISKLRQYNVTRLIGFDILEIEQGELLRIFIYSLLWRAAVVRQNDFEMHQHHQDELREILNDCLSNERDEFFSNLKRNSARIRRIQLIVTALEVKGKNNNFIYCSHNFRPYAMILNDLSFQLYFDDASNNGFDHQLQGINSVISKRALLNQQEERLKVGVISDEKRLFVNRNLSLFIFKRMMQTAEKLFIEGFNKIFGRNPPHSVVIAFRQNVVYSCNSQIEQFTPTHFCNAAIDTIVQYSSNN